MANVARTNVRRVSTETGLVFTLLSFVYLLLRVKLVCPLPCGPSDGGVTCCAIANDAGSSSITLVMMPKNFMGLFIFGFLSSLNCASRKESFSTAGCGC